MSVDENDIKAAVRRYIVEELRPGARIGDDESMLEAGLIDSMAITKLLEFIEDRFGVEIPDEEFEPENFETLNAIATLVHKKQRA